MIRATLLFPLCAALTACRPSLKRSEEFTPQRVREVKFNDGKKPHGGGVEFGEKGISEAAWRTQHALYRNGDIYHTHGAGPVALMMDINRGNLFSSLTSHATRAEGLHRYIVNHPQGGPNHPNAKLKWKLGDIVTTTIETANGQTVIVTHDTQSPRPYSASPDQIAGPAYWVRQRRACPRSSRAAYRSLPRP